MIFFEMLFDKNEYYEKEMLLKEEYNKHLFMKNLEELVDEKNMFQQAIFEIMQKFRKKNYKLSFLSNKQIILFIKSLGSPKVKDFFFIINYFFY